MRRLGFGLGLSYSGKVGASAAMAMLAGETDGLALDFTAASADSGSAAVKDTGTPANDFDGASQDLLTYSGSSAKWVYNSAGVLVESAAGTLPIDHDPTTPFARRGLLVESQRTNLILNNETMSTQNVTVTAVAHTLSFWGTGTVTLSGVSTAGPLVGTGVNDRVTLTFTPTAGTLTLTVSGTVTRGQLEAGSFATSPIPTTTVAVTRAADVVTLLTSAFPYSATEGMLFVEFSQIGSNANQLYATLHTDGNNRIQLFRPASQILTLYAAVGGVTQATLDQGTLVVGDTHKAAGVYKANDYALSVDGAAVITDISATVPACTTLNIGSWYNSTLQANSHIKRLKYLPRRMSNADLQTETAA